MISAGKSNRPNRVNADRAESTIGYASLSPLGSHGSFGSSGAPGRNVSPEKNPAMQYTVPALPERFAGWMDRQKPCDNLVDVFVPDDEFESGDETNWERKETEMTGAYVRDQCKKNCPFSALCSREALVVARDIAQWQGAMGRLYGVWGGVMFSGGETRARYQKKLDRMAEQMNNREIPWEQ